LKRHRPIWIRLAIAVLALTCAPLAMAGHACPRSPALLRSAALGYWTWSLGASARQQVGRSYFVALPEGTPNGGDGSPGNPVIYTGGASFMVVAGTTLVLPLSMWIGEAYTRASVTPDDDPSEPPKAFFTGQVVTLEVDGQKVVDSARQGLGCQYMDAAYFDDAIRYHPAEYRYTNDRGIDVAASAAIWVKGLIATIAPLAPGRHTIHLSVDTLAGWGYDNSWLVTVSGH
jgi:hypothetical protein